MEHRVETRIESPWAGSLSVRARLRPTPDYLASADPASGTRTQEALEVELVQARDAELLRQGIDPLDVRQQVANDRPPALVLVHVTSR